MKKVQAKHLWGGKKNKSFVVAKSNSARPGVECDATAAFSFLLYILMLKSSKRILNEGPQSWCAFR